MMRTALICCLLISHVPVYSAPILAEVLYDGPGSDLDDVFTELLGPPHMALDGWRLVGINGQTGNPYRTILLDDMRIPFDGVLVLATASAQGHLLQVRDYLAPVDWQNGPDALQLLDPSGRLIDALQYGNAGVFNAGFGSPAADARPGQSLARNTPFTPFWPADNAADFSLNDAPSPGSVPLAAVPEPVGFILLLTGVAIYSVFFVGRQRATIE